MEFGGIRGVKETMEVKKQCEQKEHGSIIQSSLGHVPGEKKYSHTRLIKCSHCFLEQESAYPH